MFRDRLRLTALALAAVAMTACGVSRASQKAGGKSSGNFEVGYALQIVDGEGKTQTVRDDTRLKSGDRFALLVKSSEPVHLYLFNRGPGDSKYRRLFPGSGQQARVASAWESPLRLPQDRDAWMRLDRRAGNEHLVLIASKTSIERLDGAASIGRDQVEDTLAEIERNQRPRDLERWEDGSWTRLKTDSSQPALVLICRIPLLHR
jgi:hypothetical protein